jgi:hypothetical protein
LTRSAGEHAGSPLHDVDEQRGYLSLVDLLSAPFCYDHLFLVAILSFRGKAKACGCSCLCVSLLASLKYPHLRFVSLVAFQAGRQSCEYVSTYIQEKRNHATNNSVHTQGKESRFLCSIHTEEIA